MCWLVMVVIQIGHPTNFANMLEVRGGTFVYDGWSRDTAITSR